MNAPLLLGHRGHRLRRLDEPENTLAAFDRALAAGCDGLELDLRLTADGRVAVVHDDQIECRRDRLNIAGNSLRTLRRLDPRLATLDQVLRHYGARAWLDLEIKAAEVVPALIRLLARHPPLRGYVVSCFDQNALARLGELAPHVPRCLNLRRPVPLRRLRSADVSWIAPQQASCTGWYVRRLRSEGWKVLVWTVNRRAKMRLLAEAGADAICSDNPYLLVATLADKQTG